MVDHRKLANQQGVIEGSFPTQQLQRLGGLLADQAGDVSLRLEFSRGEHDRVEVVGHVETEVALECQSCLQPVATRLSSDLSLIVVTSESELEQLDQEQDGIIHADRLIPLAALVEDELMLTLPMIPRHRDGECPGSDYAAIGRPATKQEDEPARTWRPFAGLADAIGKQKEPER